MYVELGFAGMKNQVGGLPLAQDINRVAAIREVIGHDIFLMADANQAYNATTAIRIGRELADLDIYWFEEPVNAKDIEGYLQVKAALPMAIAGGEGLRTRYEFKDYVGRRAVDIIQPDVVNVGGITEMHRVASMANASEFSASPRLGSHNDRSQLHVAAAVPECPRPTPVLPAATGDGVRPHDQPHPPGHRPTFTDDGFPQYRAPASAVEIDEQPCAN